MLKPDGQIMIIDFGTAREFKETSIEDTSCLGTQGYAAPEQYGGHGPVSYTHLPFLTDADHEALPFKNGDYIFVPNVRKAVEEKKDVINAYVVGDELKEIQLKLGDLTDAERQICLLYTSRCV